LTVDHVYVNHTYDKTNVEKSHEFEVDMYLLFVNFRQTYDSINQYKLWKSMTQLQIPPELVRLAKTYTQHLKVK